MEIAVKYEIQSLPRFCRLYRSAFSSGHGGSVGPGRQAFSRLAYYALDFLGIGDSTILARINVRGEMRPVQLNGRNRQFNPLYFAKYTLAYEPEVSLVLKDFYSDDMVFLDVGSNWGYFSVHVASQPDFKGLVHAFEPFPASFEDLDSLVADLDLAASVFCHPIALGSEETELSMTNPRHSGLAMLDREARGPRVPVRPLDSFNFERVDLIKMDLEGFEYDFLRGGGATIARCRPVIVFESDTRHESSVKTLSALNDLTYRLFVPRIGIETESGQIETTQPYELDANRLDEYRNYYDPIAPESRSEYDGYLNLVAIPEERAGTIDRVFKK